MTAESPFWRFSLRFYAQPGVAPACLRLQDEAGLDVNVLFFLLFLADRQLEVDTRRLAALDSAIAAWREAAVKPLRALRRGLKEGIGPIPPARSETLRTLIKKVELESERLEQEWLEAQIEGLSLHRAASRDAAAAANVAAYAAQIGAVLAEPLKIVLRAFTELAPSNAANPRIKPSEGPI